ncbi:MAG: acyl-CoA/acyl-ACP dehydrogenase, partial [Firmicutes bacterium]|nr:acyl-CoA/acyl-ACP dehydrogenase [Bacillota bacterium]
GGGLGVLEGSIILEEVGRSGGAITVCNAQMYTMGAVLRHGTKEQKRRYLPDIASGILRLQSMGVTEPDAGSDTPSIKTFAKKHGTKWVINGQKIFTSRVLQSDLLLLLVRTEKLEQVQKRTQGMTLFLVDMRTAGKSLEVRPVKTMINHATNQLFFHDLEVPNENVIGDVGRGFYCLLSGLNAERILNSAGAIGDGYYFIDKATQYARERVVFGRPIGQNQGIQFPLAKSYIMLEAASTLRYRAASLFDKGIDCGPDANMLKWLAAEASWHAANVAMTTFGGYGFAVDYPIERKFREARLPIVAPISNNLVLSYIGEHVLNLPRSY